MERSSASRKIYLDILRVLASFLVCFNHTPGFHLFLDQEPSGSLLSWFKVAVAVLTIMDIPLYFLISGALLLGKEESYAELFRKRVWRCVVLLICASAVMYWMKFDGERSFTGFVHALLRQQINLSYWYLYAYIGYLLALPFLRKVAKALNGKDIVYLVLVRVVLTTGLNGINFLLGRSGIAQIVLPSDIQLPFVVFDFLFYPLVGYYLANKLSMERVGGKQIAACAAVVAIGSMYSAIITYLEGMDTGFTQNYLGLCNYSTSICVFIMVRWFAEQRHFSHRVCRFFATASSVTLGIYLLEPMLDFAFQGKFLQNVPWNAAAMNAASVAWCILCMTAGGMITLLLRKIPGVRRYL